MKKILLISAVLSMYVFICGCPYQYSAPKMMPVLPSTLINVDAMLNPTDGSTWQGFFQDGTQAQFTFTRRGAAASPYYVFNISSYPFSDVYESYNCYFSTITFPNYDGTTITDTIMETVQLSIVSPGIGDHSFAIVRGNLCTDIHKSILAEIHPFPAAITNPNFQPLAGGLGVAATTPASMSNVPPMALLTGYLTYTHSTSPPPPYPPNTDRTGGSDGDTDIHGITLAGISYPNGGNCPDTSANVKPIPPPPGDGWWIGIYHQRTCIRTVYLIALLIFAFCLGYWYCHWKCKKKKKH